MAKKMKKKDKCTYRLKEIGDPFEDKPYKYAVKCGKKKKTIKSAYLLTKTGKKKK